MGNDITVKVGVSSSVAAGMDQVSKDLQKGGAAIESTAGSHGKGFSKAFVKGFKGDFSGSIETIMDKIGADMESGKGKALIWGAGIGTAFFAGWKAGKMVDEMLGISDKVAKAWNAAAVEAGKAWDEFRLKLRKIRQDEEEAVKQTAEQESKVFDIREKAAMKRMSPAEKVEYLDAGIATLELTSSQSWISAKEKKERTIMLEEMKSDYQDALDEMERDHGAFVKKTYEESVKAEKDIAEAKKHGHDVDIEFGKMALEADKKAIEDKAEADQDARDQKEKQLKAIIEAGEDAPKILKAAQSTSGWRGYTSEQRQRQREEDRKARLIGLAFDAEERGVATPRQKALLDAYAIDEGAKNAALQLSKLQEDAAVATKQSRDSLKLIQEKIDKLLMQK